MASFSTWWPLENRVSKTRFINQKNLKNFKSQAQPHLTGSNQIRERERVRSDQREGDQIREREKDLARPRSCGLRHAAQVMRPGSHGLGRATWVARPGSRESQISRGLGRATRLVWPGARAAWVAWPEARTTQAARLTRLEVRCGVWFFLGFFFVFVFFFFFSFWLWFHFCWCCCFVIYSLINRVFKTWFSSSRHVEYDATSDVNRPWKSSLLYSNC